MLKNKLKSFAKRYPRLKKALHSLRTMFKRSKNEVLPRYFYTNRFTSLLYYVFFSTSFFREFQAVLAGKAKYLKDSNVSNANYFQLTRNTHRIEKGLLMKPRRDIFAKGYIKETIDCYCAIFKEVKHENNKQLFWFENVLTEYFKITGSDPIINKQRDRFLKAKGDFGLKAENEKKIPYLRDKSNYSNISFDDFYKLSRQRRSVRWFQQDRSVPRKLIDKALKAALQAPSACNRQPFEFRIFDEPEMVEKVINTPGGTKGYAHNVPVVAVVVGNLDAYFDERDRHLIYIDASLASMSFMYALETLGLSSCPINWPDIERKEKQLELLLELDLHQRPVMLIAIGYPDEKGKVAFSEKRPLDSIRKYN